MRITALEKQQRRQRVNVFIDGVYSFSLSLPVLVGHALHVDMELSPADVAALQKEEARYNAYQAALRLLSYRLRSEKELRQRLRRRGVETSLIDEIVEKLKAQGYVNDVAFSQAWVEMREQTSPRSKRLLAWELRGKGVSGETAEAAMAEHSDEEAAYRAGLKRARSLQAAEPQEFRRRLGDFLLRRGFSWDIVRQTTERLWEELHGERLDVDDLFSE